MHRVPKLRLMSNAVLSWFIYRTIIALSRRALVSKEMNCFGNCDGAVDKGLPFFMMSFARSYLQELVTRSDGSVFQKCHHIPSSF